MNQNVRDISRIKNKTGKTYPVNRFFMASVLFDIYYIRIDNNI